MDVERINSYQSVTGQEITDWILAPKETKTSYENEVADKLYYKYMIDRNGRMKNKVFPDVFYYVNYNNKFYSNVYMAYLIRDKLKSPKRIPTEMIDVNLVGSPESYLGEVICEWAYFQNGDESNPFYKEGHELVTKYFENKHPLKYKAYYYITETSRGLRIFRDLEKSPRPVMTEDNYA